MMETFHLLQNPANAVRLLRSIEEADKGRLVEHGLLEEPHKAERDPSSRGRR